MNASRDTLPEDLKTDTEPIRVLLVDDDPEFADVAATRLEQADDRIDATTVTDADDALDRLAKTTVDCVVSDYDLPGTDGIEFLEAVRETHPDLPFVLFTGEGSEAVASEAFSAGATDYFRKGGGTDQYTALANEITNAVEKRAARRSYRDIFENATDAIFLHDPETGAITDVNPRACELLGYDRDELLEMNVGEFSAGGPSFSQAEAERRIRAAVEEGSRAFEWRVQSSEGETRWVEVHLKRAVVSGRDRVLATVRDVTERKERERERERYEALLEVVGDGVYALDPDGRYTYVNRRVEEETGYDREELVGASPTTILSEDVVGEFEDAIEGMLAGERGTFATDVEVHPKHGEPYPAEVKVTTITEDGALERTVGIVRDITERRERERTLERYETIVENISDAVWVVDEDGALEFVNRYVSDQLDTSREELLGRHVADVLLDEESIDPEVVEAFERDVDAVLQGVRDRVQTEVTLQREGAPVVRDVKMIPLESGGEVTGVVGVNRDVTERKEHERKLTALHDVAVALETSDSAERICERTIEASEDILEFDLSAIDFEEDGELTKMDISEEIPPANLTSMSVEEGLAGKTYRSGESFLVDDLEAHEDADPQGPYRSAISVPVGAHGVFQAVAEDADAFDGADLELAELLVSHTESALDRLDREQRLQRQNERLERFASVVSHDLQNPLNVADGYLTEAREECDSAALEEVAYALDRMAMLIEDLLALARTGEEVRGIEPVDLADTVDGCWQAIATGEATLVTDTEQTIRADRPRLEQLLENLVGNAVEHGGEAPTVTVGDLEGGFYVADDGPGIPPDEREAVFDAGFSTTDEGTGFGLSIVQEIVEAHGWEIAVTDGVEGGTRFEVTGVETTP